MADRTGQQLGHYRLLRLLGRGGFAEVYLGEHLRLKTQAAIKVLYTALEEDDIEGFLREAQIVARLKHPHIVRVFDFDVQDHTPYLIMDYLPNGNIRRSYPTGDNAIARGKIVAFGLNAQGIFCYQGSLPGFYNAAGKATIGGRIVGVQAVCHYCYRAPTGI
jgi:serine/threonine protein kinase